MRTCLFLSLTFLALVLQGYPLPPRCLSPHSAHTISVHFVLKTEMRQPWSLPPGTSCTGATDVDRSQVSPQDCWEGKGEPEETVQKNGRQSWILEEWAGVVGWPYTHNVGRPGAKDLSLSDARTTAMDRHALLKHFREDILYSVVSYTFMLYSCHLYSFPEFFHIPK